MDYLSCKNIKKILKNDQNNIKMQYFPVENTVGYHSSFLKAKVSRCERHAIYSILI